MKTNYNKLLVKMKNDNLTQKDFKAKVNISSGTMQSLVNNGCITTNTICKICDYFCCMPDEIMDWIPDANYPERIKAKQQEKKDIETQIAELQAKLKTL